MDLQIEAKRVNAKRVYVTLWQPINPLYEQSIRLGLLSTDLFLYPYTYVIVLQLMSLYVNYSCAEIWQNNP